jgi:hypothetical protein
MLASTRKAAIPFLLLAVSLVVFPFTVSAQAPLNSNVGNVTLSASVHTSFSVSLGVGTVNFALLPGTAVTGAPTVPITTSWSLNPGLIGSVKLYAYFDSSTVALTDGTDNIPSADVLGRVSPGAFTAFTQAGPFGAAGASLLLFTQAISGTNKVDSRTDNLDVRIDLTGLPSLPAGDYTGTMRIQAQAL